MQLICFLEDGTTWSGPTRRVGLGTVYFRNKVSNTNQLFFRDTKVLREVIIPHFFLLKKLYPLLGQKAKEFLTFVSILRLLETKAHVTDDLSGRDAMVAVLDLCLQLNSSTRVAGKRKVPRLLAIRQWLLSLKGLPTEAQISSIHARLEKIKKSRSDGP